MELSKFSKNIKNITPESEVTLKEIHAFITSDDPRESTIALRDIEQTDWAKDYKARNFKFATFSGTFTKRKEDCLKKFSGYVCIDIDDVTNLEKVKNALIADGTLQPALVFTSPSGTGIKAVYKVDKNISIDAFPYAYDFIAERIEDKHGVFTDRLPKSVVSACFLPWDTNAYLNEEAETVELPEFDMPSKSVSPKSTMSLQEDEDSFDKIEALVSHLEENEINIADSYENWRNIGFAFAEFSEEGRELFHRVSKLSPKYNQAENDKQFDACLNGGSGEITIGTFYHLLKEAEVPSGEVLKSFNKLSIVITKPEEFWTEDKHDAHILRVNRLVAEADHPLAQWVMNNYSVTHEQLCEFNIGLGQHSFKTGNIEDSLYVPHHFGLRVYALDGEQFTYEDIKGSHVTNSFFGTHHTANKSIAYIAETPFEAIALSVDAKVDVIAPMFQNGSKLSEKQSEIITEIGKYWEQVYVFRDADYGDEERTARKYVRSYADALDQDTEIWWVNPVFQGFGKNVNHNKIIAELSASGISLKSVSEYVWNTWTQKYKFWLIGGVKTPKLELDLEKLPRVLSNLGINKTYFAEEEPTLIRRKVNILEELHGHVLFDVIRDSVIGKMSKYIDISSEETGSTLIPRIKLVQVYHKHMTKILNDDFKALCLKKTVTLLEDTIDMAFLFYQNRVIKVTATGIYEVEYSDLDGAIWKSQILGRPFNPSSSSKKGEFEQFIENVCGGDTERKKAFMSCLGYHLHGYKDVGNARALILVDEFSSKGVHAGGTGKGIFAKAIRYIRKQGYIAGKNVDTESRFLFMNVYLGDQSFHFEDVRDSFDFEVLFNAITDDLQVERKGKDKFTIPFSQSPKIIISTNHTIKGNGHSFDRRQVFLPFSDYYGPHLNPQKEFGHNLFDDWNDEEWMLYDQFMIRCIQLYLKEGMIFPKTGQYKVRSFTDSTSKPFYDWAENWIEQGRDYDLRSLFRGDVEMQDGIAKVTSELHSSGKQIPAFHEVHPSELDITQSKTFNAWMQEYGNFKGWTTIKRDSNGAVLIKFS